MPANNPPNILNLATSVSPVYVIGQKPDNTASVVQTDSFGNLSITPSAANMPVIDASVGSVNTAAPLYATQIGWYDGTGKLQAVSATNPLPVTGGGGGGGGGTQYADNAASGATPTGTLAAGWDSANSKVRALKVDASQNLLVDVSNSTLAVTGTFFQATQPISGAISFTAPQHVIVDSGGGGGVQYVTGAAQATPTGTLALGWDGTDVKALPLDGSGFLKVAQQGSVAVTGTFWQTTQPVSGTFWQSTQPISGTVTANAGTGTFTVQDVASVAQGSTTSGQSGLLVQGATTTSAPTYTNLKTNPLSLDTSGNLRTSVTNTVAVSGTFWQSTQPVSGTFWQTTQPVSGTFWQATQPVSGTVAVSGVSGVVEVGPTGSANTKTNQFFNSITDGTNTVTINSTTTTSKYGLDTNILSILGTAPTTAGFIDIKGADGNVFVRQTTAANLNATVVGTGTFAVQAAATLNAETTKVIGTVNVAASQTIAVTNAGTFAVQSTNAAETTKVIGTVRCLGNVGAAFDAATAATAPANAIQAGLVAATAYPTAVTGGQLVGAMGDKAGRQVVVLNAPRDLIGSVSVQSTTSSLVSLIAAGSTGVFNDIVSATFTNESASATIVSLSDGTTTYKFALAANGGISYNPATPLPATSTATAWTFSNSASNTVDAVVIFAKNK